ncbi:hypothetical protein FRX31_006564 [Thalictrum thalictroides]|uniref:Uncharacterized protein n=1 Tax=Thalictrum thalictroides TaxID=46969 RepID=A0A7J6X470_THATH|nr:hypothetical protein FRX31_006564 [Thalictrum thalictroides]
MGGGGGVIKIYPGFISISDECEEDDINCCGRKKVEYYDEYPQDYLSVPKGGVIKIYPGFIRDESGDQITKKVEYYDDDLDGEESDDIYSDEEYYYYDDFVGDGEVSDDIYSEDYCVQNATYNHNLFPRHIIPADSGKPMPWERSLVADLSPTKNPVFFTRCTSGGKLWDMVIGSDACYNFVSYDMVVELNLMKKPIREPFLIHGPLTNVWIYDRNATYSAADYSYSFNDNYEQIVLTSLPYNTQLDFTVSRKIIYD